MKIMVRLIVLMATLLLLNGVSFANGDCYDYEYIRTNLDNPDNQITDCIELCFNEGDNSGTYANFCGGSGNLVLFFDSMNTQALLYSTSPGPHMEIGYLKFHGDWLHVFTAIIYCSNPGGNYRYGVRGNKADECKVPG
jgi:hypothetical protein